MSTGVRLSINKIFGIYRKLHGRSKYLLSVNIMVGKDCYVCTTFICTNLAQFKEEIICIFRKWWQKMLMMG